MTAPERWFEDYRPGLVVTGGPISVSEAEILDFARRYDPQPMHTDAAAAMAGQFGGLIASGWHTAALTMRLVATEFLWPASGLASPGIDELRWLKPVRPGDSLTLRATVLEARPSRSKPYQGILRSLVEILNQHGEVVMTMKPISIIRRRPPPPV
jgi:acyl dehydratase